MNARHVSKNRREFLRAIAATAALSSVPYAVLAAESAGKRKIGIIGSGNIGGTLGRIWANAGHAVMFSSLDLEHDKKLAAEVGANASAGTPRDLSLIHI